MISRRDALKLASVAAVCRKTLTSAAQVPNGPSDYKLEISPVTLDLSPRRRLKTNAYNGQAPGPLLRFKEGRSVTVEVTNRTDVPEVVHWHGLFLPAALDGAMEEGTAPIAPNTTARYTFTPRPAGFRWYHTHNMAMGDFARGQYSGQHGFLLIEPRDNPAHYDQELFLALHDWDGYLLSSDDGAMNPGYKVSTVNGKTLGFGEPLRVRQGQRVLLHILNSSATETHWISLAGHACNVMALDGNAVPTSREVPMLRLAPAERVCAVVEMSNPGVWILGEVRKHIQAAGMGIVVEYAGRGGAPQWRQPDNLEWNYEQFGATGGLQIGAGGGSQFGAAGASQIGARSGSQVGAAGGSQIGAGDGSQIGAGGGSQIDARARSQAGAPGGSQAAPPPTLIPLVFESRFRGHGAMEAWTINGKSYPDVASDPLRQGERYRLQLINASTDDHPLHLHRHSFELCGVDAPLGSTDRHSWTPLKGANRGIIKDVVLVKAGTRTEVEFTANNPGPALFHCHQQNHMDLGFMMLFRYA